MVYLYVHAGGLAFREVYGSAGVWVGEVVGLDLVVLVHLHVGQIAFEDIVSCGSVSV